MPDLDDIKVFVEVVECGSLTRAALRLGMSKSMISRRLSRLEAELGMPLLARTTRGLSLTEAGTDFRPFAQRMVAELEAARDALSRQGEATGRLRLGAPMSFGSTHLAPVLAELALRHPRLEINCAYSDRLVDVVGEGFDAAIRLGVLADSTLVARRIAPIRLVLVASPRYLSTRGTPVVPADLDAHDAIPHGDETWRFQQGGRTFTHRPRGRFMADSGLAEFAGVVAGLGVAILPLFLAQASLERGEIVTILDGYQLPELGLYIVRPPPAEPVPMKIKVLTEIMVERFGRGDRGAYTSAVLPI